MSPYSRGAILKKKLIYIQHSKSTIFCYRCVRANDIRRFTSSCQRIFIFCWILHLLLKFLYFFVFIIIENKTRKKWICVFTCIKWKEQVGRHCGSSTWWIVDKAEVGGTRHSRDVLLLHFVWWPPLVFPFVTFALRIIFKKLLVINFVLKRYLLLPFGRC